MRPRAKNLLNVTQTGWEPSRSDYFLNIHGEDRTQFLPEGCFFRFVLVFLAGGVGWGAFPTGPIKATVGEAVAAIVILTSTRKPKQYQMQKGTSFGGDRRQKAFRGPTGPGCGPDTLSKINIEINSFQLSCKNHRIGHNNSSWAVSETINSI